MKDILEKTEAKQTFYESLRQVADELSTLTPEQFRERAEKHTEGPMHEVIHMISKLSEDEDDRSVEE